MMRIIHMWILEKSLFVEKNTLLMNCMDPKIITLDCQENGFLVILQITYKVHGGKNEVERTSIREEKLAVLSMEYFNVSGMAGE